MAVLSGSSLQSLIRFWGTIGDKRSMLTCRTCHEQLSPGARFCPKCGRRVIQTATSESSPETLNLRILYIMVGLLLIAVLFPPWESAPGEPPEYLGLHFILSPPRPGAVVSRMLQTVELVTIALAGLYGAWLFRGKGR